MMFRTYDPAWNRTGWAEKPQYSGQQALTHDFPLNCPACGKQDIVAVSIGINGYTATCRCGEVLNKRPIAELAA